MRMLITQHGADVNFKNKEGEGPIVHAIASRCTETAELLLQHGADVNIPLRWGGTLLDTELYNSTIDEQKILLLMKYGGKAIFKNQYWQRNPRAVAVCNKVGISVALCTPLQVGRYHKTVWLTQDLIRYLLQF